MALCVSSYRELVNMCAVYSDSFRSSALAQLAVFYRIGARQHLKVEYVHPSELENVNNADVQISQTAQFESEKAESKMSDYIRPYM